MPIGYYAPAAGLLWKLVDSYGVDAETLFAQFGVSRELLNDPEKRLPNDTMAALWREADATIGDPYMGLSAARHAHPSHAGALGYAWLASRTLRAALERMSRFVHLLTEEREVRLEDGGDEVLVVTRLEPQAYGNALRADIGMTTLMTMCRWNAGPKLAATQVSFRHERPRDVRPFETFFRCPVSFQAERNVIGLRRSDVERPLPSGNAQLAQLHDDHLASYVRRLSDNDIQSRARAAVIEDLSEGSVRLEAVANRLHISPRTLQRRLRESGTSFRELVESTRKELVERLLRDRRLSMMEIAFCTGFANQSGLSTAVRGWFGMTPSTYRQQSLARPTSGEG